MDMTLFQWWNRVDQHDGLTDELRTDIVKVGSISSKENASS